MKLSPTHLAFGFLLAIAGIPVSACSVIGYNIGESIDEGHVTRDTVHVADLGKVQIGDTCIVTRPDSCVFTGEYRGLRVVPRSEFLQLYDQWKAADTTRQNMPSIGDSVEIVWVSRPQPPLRGRLTHISTDSLALHERRDAGVYVRRASFRDIQTVSSASSGRIDGQQIWHNTADPSFPRTTHFIFTIDGQEVATSADSIAFIDVVQSTNPVGWRIGCTGFGVLLDVAILVGLSYGAAALAFASQ